MALQPVPLSEADKLEVAKMFKALSDIDKAQANGHRCWFFLPTPSEYERMAKFAHGDQKCPKCGKGRIVVEVYHGNIGDSWHAVCKWGADGCDFKEYISDDE